MTLHHLLLTEAGNCRWDHHPFYPSLVDKVLRTPTDRLDSGEGIHALAVKPGHVSLGD